MRTKRTTIFLPLIFCVLAAVTISVVDTKLLPSIIAVALSFVVVMLIEDMVALKRTERHLRESGQQVQEQFAELEQVYRTLPVGLCFMDCDLRFLRINDELAAINGLPAEEHIGKHVRDVLPGIADTIEPIYRGVLNTGAPALDFEVSKAKPDNPRESGSYLVSYYPVVDQQDSVIGVSTVVQDITHRKRAERALRDSEAQTTAILASLSAHIAVIDHTGAIVAVNPAWEEFARNNEGLAASCGAGANYLDACRTATGESGDEAQAAAEGLQAILEGKIEQFSLEYPCHSATQQRWFLMEATPLRDGNAGAVVSHTIITGRVQAEQLLRASEQRMRAVLNTAADAIITIDQRGIIESVNRATTQMFGYSQEELIGQNVKVLMPSPYREEHDRYIARYLKTGEPHIIGSIGRDVAGRRKDGSSFPISLAVSEVPSLGVFTGIIRDISQRRKLERDVLRIAENEQQRIGQDLHDSIQQELAGLGLLAQTLMENLATQQVELDSAKALAASELATKVVSGIARTQHDVQGISRGLVPIRLDAPGFMDALRQLASKTDDLAGVSCALKCERPVELADSLIATHLYRIAQEAVTNALKHGRPQHILIAMENEGGRLILQVADDGTGFDPTEQQQGMGLKTMRYRASLIGASLTVSPVDTGGTLVTCEVFGGNHGD